MVRASFRKMQINKLQEEYENVIELHEDADVIKSLVRYCYAGNYDNYGHYTYDALVKHHAMVYVAARKYLLDGLCKLAKEKWVLSLFPFSYDGNTGVKEYLDMVQYIYENPTDSKDILRRAAVIRVRRHCLLKIRTNGKDVWHDFVTKVPDFAVDLMLAAGHRLKTLEEYVNTSKPQRCECEIYVRGDADESIGKCDSCGKDYVTNEDDELVDDSKNDDEEDW